MKIGKQITESMLVNGNRIKNKMMDMYHDEYYAYVNKVKEIQILKQAFKTKIFEIRSKKKVINIIAPENKIFLFNSTIFSRTRFT